MTPRKTDDISKRPAMNNGLILRLNREARRSSCPGYSALLI